MSMDRLSATPQMFPSPGDIPAPVKPTIPVSGASVQEAAAAVAARTMAGNEDPIIPDPSAPMAALHSVHTASWAQLIVLGKIRRIMELQAAVPDAKAITIFGSAGQYTQLDQGRYECKSISIYNPGAYPIYIGPDGEPATPASNNPFCPPGSCLTLPISCKDINFGCPAATLGGNNAVFWLYRYVSVQPLQLS